MFIAYYEPHLSTYIHVQLNTLDQLPDLFAISARSHRPQNLLPKHVNDETWQRDPRAIRNNPQHNQIEQGIMANILESREELIQPCTVLAYHASDIEQESTHNKAPSC